MRTWFPEAYFMPDGAGGYRPTYKQWLEAPFTLVPGKKVYPTSGQARDAAVAYLIALEPPIRAFRVVEPETNVLGREEWLKDKAGRPAREQQQALGAIIVKGRQVKVETTKRRARA